LAPLPVVVVQLAQLAAVLVVQHRVLHLQLEAR
jgi:hypothetical protein